GVKNFLNRLWDFVADSSNLIPDGEIIGEKSLKRFHQFLKAYQNRLATFKVNTAVSAIMEYLNDLNAENLTLNRELLIQFLTAISVMVPHIASELLEKIVGVQLQTCTWPTYNETLAQVNEIEIGIQVNGKLRGTITIAKGSRQTEVQTNAQTIVDRWIEGKQVIKVIFDPDRLINFVIK
ncbi:MAG: class I tRNA ligase family protein, partial [bacterium]